MSFAYRFECAKLGHRIYGVMVLVSRLAPLQDISDVLAKSGIESALDAV